MYRSPSSKNLKFIERLGNLSSKLKRHKNKIIHLVGDFNIDLANYDNDFHCHDLINKMAENGFAQLISLPTRVTDHTATIIDHIYGNKVHTTVNSYVVTLDISDHLGTYVQFRANQNFTENSQAKINSPESDFIDFRKFNAANMEKFEELIRDESWGDVEGCTTADNKYDK